MKQKFQSLLTSLPALCSRAKSAIALFLRPFRDAWLAVALLLGVLLGAQGLTWGTYDCLNLDRMALNNVVAKQRPLLHPGSFFKPPLYTYMNHFLARVPAQTLASNLFWIPKGERFDLYLKLRLVLARFWNLVLFGGCVVIVYDLARKFYGVTSARVAALLLATSAGFIPYQVYLTTDLAVVFVMLASFACAAAVAQTPTMGWSIAAGILAGMAGATKYNGLAVAAALPLAHLIGSRGNPFLDCLKRPSAWACGLAVPVGFLLSNPYSLLDFGSFKSDFLYNYKVTPVYGGETGVQGYGRYFNSYFEIFGWPGVIFILAGIAVGLFVVAGSLKKSQAWKLWLLALVVGGFYTWKIGSFPRVETRFVLPSAPFALLLAAAGFGAMMRARWIAIPALAAVLIFNLACGWWVGEMFRGDPRNGMLAYARAHIPRDAVIEVSASIPRLADLPDRDFELVKIPSGYKRWARFSEQFAEDGDVMRIVTKRKETSGLDWFTPEARKIRNPAWIFWSDIDIDDDTRPYYEALFRENPDYRMVMDGSSPELPLWVYPRHTEFLRNRATVWMKTTPHL